jgi:hypothetical protein
VNSKPKLSQNQWATELNRSFSKDEIQMAKKKTHEKMLTISSHKGNANKNHTKIPPQPLLEYLSSKTPPPTGVGKDMERKEPSYTADGNAS